MPTAFGLCSFFSFLFFKVLSENFITTTQACLALLTTIALTKKKKESELRKNSAQDMVQTLPSRVQ